MQFFDDNRSYHQHCITTHNCEIDGDTAHAESYVIGLFLNTVPARVTQLGDPSAEIDAHAGSLAGLLELAQRDEEAGLPDAPWPPNFRKMPGEAKRVQPSKARKE